MTDEFTFAIITDTHIRSPKGDASSPFPVNEKANGRARYAARLISLFNPELTIHLGDVVHPLPHMTAYAEAAEEAGHILEPLRPNLYTVPGNHDIGDKPSPGMPAKSLTEESLEIYRGEFGADFGAVNHHGINFVWINSSLVNTGLAEETEQQRWLEQKLNELQGQKIFLFSHYPPFICSAEEPDHYDNYAEPGRSWLLDLAADKGVEAIFSGHVHHFFFNRYKDVKLYCLPATSFTRQDYGELFPLEPAGEFGRDDTGKFGVSLVTIDGRDHRLQIVPTDGTEVKPGEPLVEPQTVQQYPDIIPHLRHSWFEVRSLPYNGPMEEFSRKPVRNDYPLLRLLQLDIPTVRTPLADLLDPKTGSRLQDWGSLGFKFVLFNIGIPDDAAISQIRQNSEIVHALEVLIDKSGPEQLRASKDTKNLDIPVPVWISGITSSADSSNQTGPFAHMVSSGFPISNLEIVCEQLQETRELNYQGIVFQIEWGEDPVSTIEEGASIIRKLDVQPVANLRLSLPNPADANTDLHGIASVLDKARQAASTNGVILQCDTFEDVDRGYCPRLGFIDRYCNLRRLPDPDN